MKEIKEKIIVGQKYKFKKDFYRNFAPIVYQARKGEIVMFEGQSLGYANFGKENGKSLVLNVKEVFEYLTK